MVASEKQRMHPLGKLEKVYLGILLVVFGGIVLHAPLSVWLGTVWPDYVTLIKSWKEILIVIAAVIALILLRRKKQIAVLKEPLMIGIGIYLAIHLLVLALFGGDASATSAGLAIDVRYILYFALVFIAMRLYPSYKMTFIKVGIAGALVVMVFAILQAFILPADILKYIGYSTSTIAPYLTVDQNIDFIRINSTLRGPNPLGAYAVIVLTLLITFWLRRNRQVSKWQIALIVVLEFGGLVALWASYSRSALVGAAVALAIILATVFYKKLSRTILIVSSVVVIVGAGLLIASMNTNFVSNVLLHENPAEGSSINSNQGHVSSIEDGMRRLIVQPFGAGIGSTGSASLYTDTPLIIENQYLFVAHETGWLGLAFFMMIFIGILTRLWDRRKDWLAIGIFASGIGLVVIGLLLPVWADETVAIIWWGLAGIVLGARHG